MLRLIRILAAAAAIGSLHAPVVSCRRTSTGNSCITDPTLRRNLVRNALSCRQEALIGKANALSPIKANDDALHASSPSSSRSLRMTLLALMVVQNSATVLVGRHTRSRPKEELFQIQSFVISCELIKLLLSCVLEYQHSGGHLLRSIRDNIFTSKESLLILVPSLLYLIQNTLQHVALTNLSAPVFQVTYQFKLVTTALASVVFLNRKYSVKQWTCLITLGVGVATVVLGERVTVVKEAVTDAVLSEEPHVHNLALGLVAVGTACISSALASVSLEKMLKATSSSAKKDGKSSSEKKSSVSLWLRNIELAIFSLCIALARRQHSIQTSPTEELQPFFHGFSHWVYLLLVLQAGGGLLVAAVMKYTDNVLKGLATGVSVVVSSAGSALLFGTPINVYLFAGAGLVLGSVYLFTNNLPSLPKRSSSDDEN